MAGEMRWGTGRKKAYDLRIMKVPDQDADLSYLEDERKYEGVPREEADLYRKQDRERLESFGTDWYMIGMWAEATLEIGGVEQTLRSGGLWGIESDSDQSYLESMAQDEYDQLQSILKKVWAIAPALSEAKWVDRA